MRRKHFSKPRDSPRWPSSHSQRTSSSEGVGAVDESRDFLLGMGMVRGLVGFAGADAHDKVIEAVRSSLSERYEPGVGVRLGAGALLVTALT
jgi:hypothetical protein